MSSCAAAPWARCLPCSPTSSPGSACPKQAVTRAGPDIAGVRKSLEWALPGDLLVLAVHQDRRAVLELLNGLTKEHWKAGEPLPK